MKCPYCKSKNLYLKRTFPTEIYSCKDCEKKIQHLRKCGLNNRQIEKVIKRKERQKMIWICEMEDATWRFSTKELAEECARFFRVRRRSQYLLCRNFGR